MILVLLSTEAGQMILFCLIKVLETHANHGLLIEQLQLS